MVAARLGPVYAAKERQRASGHKGGVLPANLPEPLKGEACEKAAAETKVSPCSVQDAKTVLHKAAPGPPHASIVARGSLSPILAAGPSRSASHPTPSLWARPAPPGHLRRIVGHASCKAL